MTVTSLDQQAIKFDRVSSRDQVDGFSLEAQRVLGEKYARDNGLKLVRTWSVDESASKEEDRKHFFAMIDYVKEKKIKHVVFDKVDRACRGLKSAVQIEELIDSHGVKFHFTREHLIIDADSPPQEKLRFYLGMILGKYYIDNLKVEIHKGLEARLQAGFWNGLAPIGYRNVKADGKDQKAKVVIDPETAPVVREVFQLYVTGNYSYVALAKHLRERTPKKHCTRRAVELLICNPFYYGVMKVRTRGLGGKMETRFINGKHEPLIEKGLWDACQKVKGIRAATHQLSNVLVTPKPFMGWLKCGECGHQVTGEVHKKPSGRIYVYYHCAHRNCPQKRKNVVEAIIMQAIQKAFEPFARFSQEEVQNFVKVMEESILDMESYTQLKTTELTGGRAELKKEILELEVLRAEGKLSEKLFNRIAQEKETQLKENELGIRAHQRADIRAFQEGRRVIELLHLVHNFIHLDGKDLEKARVAKMVLSNPKLKDGTLEFSYEKPFDVLIDLTTKHDWSGKRGSNPRPSAWKADALAN